jgi:hypothetical protein
VHSVKEWDARSEAKSGKWKTFLHLRHLERCPLRTPYTDVADGVAALMRSETLNSYEYDPSRAASPSPESS